MTEQIILKNIVKQRDRIIKGGLKAAKSDLREVVNSKSMSATNNDVIKTLGNVSEELLSKRKKVISQAEQIKALKEQIQSLKGRHDNESKESALRKHHEETLQRMANALGVTAEREPVLLALSRLMKSDKADEEVKEELVSDEVPSQATIDKVMSMHNFATIDSIEAALSKSDLCERDYIKAKPILERINHLALHSNELNAVMKVLCEFEPTWATDGEPGHLVDRMKDAYQNLKVENTEFKAQLHHIETDHRPAIGAGFKHLDGTKWFVFEHIGTDEVMLVREDFGSMEHARGWSNDEHGFTPETEVLYWDVDGPETTPTSELVWLAFRRVGYLNDTLNKRMTQLEEQVYETQPNKWNELCEALGLEPTVNIVHVSHAYDVCMYLCKRLRWNWYTHPINLKNKIEQLCTQKEDSRELDKLQAQNAYLIATMTNSATNLAKFAQALLTPENVAKATMEYLADGGDQ